MRLGMAIHTLPPTLDPLDDPDYYPAHEEDDVPEFSPHHTIWSVELDSHLRWSSDGRYVAYYYTFGIYAGHWITAVAYFLPVVVFLGWLAITQIRERRRND